MIVAGFGGRAGATAASCRAGTRLVTDAIRVASNALPLHRERRRLAADRVGGGGASRRETRLASGLFAVSAEREVAIVADLSARPDATAALYGAGTQVPSKAVTITSQVLPSRHHAARGNGLLPIALAGAVPLGARSGHRAASPLVQSSMTP